MGNMILKDSELEQVIGGKTVTFEEKRDEFESAWKKLGMTEKGYGGMSMAEIFDEWEMSEKKVDAITFLSKYK